MTTTVRPRGEHSQRTSFGSDRDTDIATFARQCEQTVSLADYPLAESVEQRVLIYRGDTIVQALAADPLALYAELNRALSSGPGVVAIRDTFPDLDVVDRHSAVLERVMAKEAEHRTAGDHFAAAGANTRLWNAIQKAAVEDPESFIAYYRNPIIHAVSYAWLGPGYSLTAQINVVHPGGKAQQPHRDYHLGFQTNEVAAQYPLAVHRLSPLLTLQGAVAHTDMPIASGPTQLLPFSHQYELGYLAWRQDAFKEYFAANRVQLALNKGDQLYFNPALFHAAGDNETSDLQRMANLLQVSSAFGKPMESLDHDAMTQALYRPLCQQFHAGTLTEADVKRIASAAAEGYSFPTNLDSDPPVGGLAPTTGEALLVEAVRHGWTSSDYQNALTLRAEKRRA